MGAVLRDCFKSVLVVEIGVAGTQLLNLSLYLFEKRFLVYFLFLEQVFYSKGCGKDFKLTL